MQVIKEKQPADIGSAPTKDPVPKETQDQMAAGEIKGPQ